ncbi:YozE family protein [Marisediminicola sp. LYQ134]|uniref:YozE family protein n=1 Tax=unclassified Marisediminicola TaxID=2618316 RepID=UPI00398366DB
MTESFRDWLLEQAERPDEVGELAGSVKDDALFPEHGGKAIYDGYFSADSQSPESHAAFERAWDEFEGTPIGS